MFQSTHSLRSATLIRGASRQPGACFNPRTPCGVRLVYSPPLTGTSKVSIHALLAECDTRPDCGCPRSFVSIHALLAECDRFGDTGGQAASLFQSTHSLRSATPSVTQPSHKSGKFQSTHSLRSATFDAKPGGKSNVSFNPRTPCGVRLRPTLYIATQQSKSYFAPTSLKRPSLHGCSF